MTQYTNSNRIVALQQNYAGSNSPKHSIYVLVVIKIYICHAHRFHRRK